MLQKTLIPFSSSAILLILVSTTACKVVRPFHPNIEQGGRVEALAVDPSNNNNVMVASQTGGLFRSSNGGTNWTWINTPVFRFTDVQYAPWNASLVVASAESDWYRNSKGGVWISTNSGSSFVKVTQADGCAACDHKRTGWCVEMDRFRSQVYVGTDTGIYKGDNAGVNWTYSSPKTTGDRSVFSILAVDNNSVIALCDDGLYESTNGGDSWARIFTKPGSVDFIGRHNNLARSPYNSNSLFMTVGYWRNIRDCNSSDQSHYSELWFSADKGRNWRVIRNRNCWGSRNKFVRVAKTSASSTNQLDVYAYSGIQLKKTTGTQNGNKITFGSWSDFNMPHDYISDICFDNDGATAKLVGGDGGLFKPSGSGWVYTGGGAAGYNALQITEVIGQKNTSTNAWTLYFSTQDNDIKSSDNGGATWTGNRCCEGFFINTLRTTNGLQPSYFTGVSCGGCGNFRAENNLTNQQDWPNPPNDAGNPFMLSYNSYIQNTRRSGVDSNIYMLTTNYGSRWDNRFGFKEGVADFPRSTQEVNPTVYIAADNLSGRLSGGIAKRILKKVVNPTGPGSPIISTVNNFGGLGTMATEFAWYKVFAVSPSNSNIILITDLEDSTMKITNDGGLTWSVARTLTNLVTDNGRLRFRDGEHSQVSAIGFDPAQPCHILVGTQQNGVIRTTNGGLTWEKIEGSERIPLITSFFFLDNNQVVVSSYGRGLWKLHYRFPRVCVVSVLDTAITRYNIPSIRDLVVGAYVPFSDINDVKTCPECFYVIAQNGFISNIKLDEKGRLLSYERGGATIVYYDSKNNRIDSMQNAGRENIPRQQVKNSVLEDVVRKREPVKGMVLENGLVKAVILSNKDFNPADYKRFFDTNPQLSLEDTATRFYFSHSGYRLRGRFWNPASPIQLIIDGKEHDRYSQIQPDARGDFEITITLPFDVGGHTIQAVQKTANKLNEAIVSWNVALVEVEKLKEGNQRPGNNQ